MGLGSAIRDPRSGIRKKPGSKKHWIPDPVSQHLYVEYKVQTIKNTHSGVAGGVCGKGTVRRGVARPLEGRERCRQDILQSRREILAQGVGHLPDGHAQVVIIP
jgi:hypothetical protein